MPGAHTPNMRARWLGELLRELREAKGVTSKAAAQYLERSPGTMSRYESGEYPIRRADLLALIDFYGVPDPAQRDRMFKLREESWKTDWWDDYADDVDEPFIDYVWLEQRAHQIKVVDNWRVPGLLQHPSYTAAVLEIVEADSDPTQRARWAELRQARQHRLDQEDPPAVQAIVDEAVLYRPIGGPEVMAEQLRHLQALSERPKIDIRVLPLRSAAPLSGMFTLFSLGEPFPADVACIETLVGARYVEAPNVQQVVQAYNRLWAIAQDLGAPDALIAEALKEYT
ncbi:MAG: helix-turn-helix domain-containing protein [Micromonosporaceae bacterium]|nr:helix-turn-helix domain-containing protein [Micromonosporaceae bacterium]